MNVYDTANKLAQEMKASSEYASLKMAKEVIDLKPELKEKIKEFEKIRYDVQIEVIQQGKENTEKMKKMQELYAELIENEDSKRYFDAELKFNVMLADVNKIIGDVVKDLM